MEQKKVSNIEEIAIIIIDNLMKSYLIPIHKYIEENPHLIKTVSGFLLRPDKIVIYLGKKHLAIEYFGPERIDDLNKVPKEVDVNIIDFSQSNEIFLEKIIGFKYETNANFVLTLMPFSEQLVLPTNSAFDKLEELKWNFAAQNSMLGFNGRYTILDDEFSSIRNSLFFDADDNGLKTRHIKWIDFLPIVYDESGKEFDNFKINFYIFTKLIEYDCNYEYYLPSDFKYKKLPQINRFIEIVGNKLSLETDITKFLENENNKFILTMGFLAKDIFYQLKCEWQSEEKENLIPDFFVLRPNGFADIVEFKLPELKHKSVVGINNRETFSSELNSYISQTRVYRDYFDDPNNRKWFEKNYGFKVHKPRRYLVIGRRWDFNIDVWKDIISDYKDIDILTYEDLIDGVTAQFYL